jgi:hypothetical protein
MAVVADSGPLYAVYDRRDVHHRTVLEVLRQERGPVFVPMAILAEVDYLLGRHLGVRAELSFLDDLRIGAYQLVPLGSAALERVRELVAKYSDRKSGLADAAVVAAAEELGIERILTTDERHFRAVRPTSGKPFVLLPADARG